LCAEIINFVGLNIIDDSGEVAAIGEVAVNETKIGFFVGVLI
jgi:hypothetical protein